MEKKKLNILIVEDEMVSQRLIREILTPYGNCDIAENGEEAVNIFRMSLDNGNGYDLICMDIMMPEVSGHQAIRLIREIEESYGLEINECVNIIMISALDDPRNVVEAFKDHGATGYITKPVKRDELLKEIRSLNLI